MKIAITCFNLGWLAGGPRLIFAQARAMQQMGHSVTIYAPDFDPGMYPELTRGLHIVSVPSQRTLFTQDKFKTTLGNVRRKIRDERAQAALARTMAQRLDADFDVVNCHDFSYRIIPFYKARNPHSKILWTTHEPPFIYLPKPHKIYDALSRAYNWYQMNALQRKYVPLVDGVVLLNERNKRWAESCGFKAVTAYPGVDSAYFHAPVKQRAQGDLSVRVLCVGAPNQYRRFEDTLRATGLLRQRGYDASVTVVGKNIWNEDTYCEFLKSIARDGGFADHAMFRLHCTRHTRSRARGTISDSPDRSPACR